MRPGRMGRVDDTRRWYVASAPERYGRLRVERENLGAARWLAELGPGHEDFGTVAGIAVPGFAAYVRVLHPASPDERPVSWAEVAADCGRSVEPGTEWHRPVGMERLHHNASDHGRPGVRDEHPAEGPTPVGVARHLLPVPARRPGPPNTAGSDCGPATAARASTRCRASRRRTGRGCCSPGPWSTSSPPSGRTRSRSCRTCDGRRTAPGAWAATWTWSARTSADHRS